MPGSTASSGVSGSATAERAVVHQHDVIGGKRQFVAAAGGVAVDCADVNLLGILDASSIASRVSLVNLQKVYLGAMSRLAEHADIGAGTEYIVLARLDDDAANLRMSRNAVSAPHR